MVLAFGVTAFNYGQSASETTLGQKEADAGTAVVLTVTAPTQFVAAVSTVSLALQVSDTTGQGVLGYRGEITYDPAVIQTTGGNAGCNLTETISSGMTPFCSDVIVNATTRKITFFVSGAVPLMGAGDLIKINFQVVGVAGSSSPLVFTDFFFNEGGPTDPSDIAINGLATVSLSPTAAGASVSGSVVSVGGRPVAKVRVSLTDGMDVVRYAITNAFGFYAFEDVPTGSVYVVNARSKGYTFPPRVITLLDDLAGLDLVAER